MTDERKNGTRPPRRREGPRPEGHPLKGTRVFFHLGPPRKVAKQETERPALPEGTARPEEARDLFSPAEYRVLSHFLDRSPAYRELEADLEEILSNAPWNSVDAAVAKIVLERIQERLPNWMVKNEAGDWIETRTPRKARAARRVLMRPIYVGAREGDGAGPGMGWFCHYYATWVPLFDRFVVTESNDSGEDRAMGSFDAATGFDDASLLEIFKHDWITDDESVRGSGIRPL